MKDCVGQKSSIFVKICGTLSENEDSCTKNKENIELTLNHTKQNKKRKLKTKKHPKIKKGIRELESESTTSEDIELSVHSDSDLVDICSEDEEDGKVHYDDKSSKVIDLDDIDKKGWI